MSAAIGVTPVVRLPRDIAQTYTYEVPPTFSRPPTGSLVRIPWRGRTQLGVVEAETAEQTDKKLSPIAAVLPLPQFSDHQFALRNTLETEYHVSRSVATLAMVPRFTNNAENKLSTLSKLPSAPQVRPPHEAIVSAVSETAQLHLYGQLFDPTHEVFLAIVHRSLASGKQALLLFGDVRSLRLAYNDYRKFFGDRALLWASSEQARGLSTPWQRLGNGESCVLLGTRQALFAPFTKLDQVILFDAHNAGHRSRSAHPRYAATALIDTLPSKMRVTVTSSGSPLVPRYPKALLWASATSSTVQRIERDPTERRQLLPTKVEEAFRSARGPLLCFVNRRGYAATVCGECGTIPRCVTCDRPLVYETRPTNTTELHCHHCGQKKAAPERCADCQAVDFRLLGLGVARATEALAELFPDRAVQEHTATKPLPFITDKTILVTTRAITPALWSLPRFAASVALKAEGLLAGSNWQVLEQAYDTLESLRLATSGPFFIDSAEDHPLFRAVATGKPEALRDSERKTRGQLTYPPYGSLAVVFFATEEARDEFANSLPPQVTKSQLPPERGRARLFCHAKDEATLQKVWEKLPPTALVDPSPEALL